MKAVAHRAWGLHVVVLDRYADSWFIADSSLRGYDGVQNVRDEEHPVGQKKLVRKAELPSKSRIRWPRWTGFRGMTVRDWLDLLVVPLAHVVISFLFTAQQDQRQQRTETQRAEAERMLAEQRAQDDALQAYLDQMSTLLLEKNLRNSSSSEEDSEVRTLARARTLTALGRLDSDHNSNILQFLREAQLISGTDPVVRLSESNLSGAKLRGADLNNIDLSGANLTSAELYSPDLSDANLSRADLIKADLLFANLRWAVLDNANLGNAQGVTDEQLAEVKSLKGATMPDGQKYEDWIKVKEGSGKDGENE